MHPDASRYMLDTNTAGCIIKGMPEIVRMRLCRVPIASVCISVITEAELRHGVARKPEAKNLPRVVREFLSRVDILPWDSAVAEAYAAFRARCEHTGKSLSAIDMLIAAHAIAAGAVLVTSDSAFHQVAGDLTLEDWTQP